MTEKILFNQMLWSCFIIVLTAYQLYEMKKIWNWKIIGIILAFGIMLFQRMFSPYSRIYQLISIDGIEGIILAMLLLLASILVVFVLNREKRIDIF